MNTILHAIKDSINSHIAHQCTNKAVLNLRVIKGEIEDLLVDIEADQKVIGQPATVMAELGYETTPLHVDYFKTLAVVLEQTNSIDERRTLRHKYIPIAVDEKGGWSADKFEYMTHALRGMIKPPQSSMWDFFNRFNRNTPAIGIGANDDV